MILPASVLHNMNNLKPKLLRQLLNTLYLGRAHRVLNPLCSGVGAIFTLHHVRPMDYTEFSPNRILNVTPEFLEQTIHQVRHLGREIVSLDEVARRLREQDSNKKFVCFTLDDGYIDNYTYAAPIFDRLQVPYTVYVATGMPGGTSILWWQHLEDIIQSHEAVDLTVGNERFRLNTRGLSDKYRAYGAVYWALRKAPHTIQQSAIHQMLARYEVNPVGLCKQSAMSWSQLRELSAGRATIGVHTKNHYALSKLSQEEVCYEAEESRRILAEQLNVQPAHFCYPYGDGGSAGPREFELIAKLGFATATTTRKGVLFPEHRDHLYALPRISLNGDYQNSRYVALFLSGAPFALNNGFRRLDVA